VFVSVLERIGIERVQRTHVMLIVAEPPNILEECGPLSPRATRDIEL
jgi:hypothetical protein